MDRAVRRVVLITSLLLVLLPGCKSLNVNDLPGFNSLPLPAWLKNFVTEREEVTYYPTAKENFSKGMDLYIKEEWQDAGKYFDYVKTKFPHSRYAVIAELRLADANFGKEKWLDAIDSYRSFIRLHPTHDEVPYATFQIAKAYYRQIPEEWFFLPPVAERDQSAAMDAVRAFDDFMIRFPDHERAAEAKNLRKDARGRLANHEWYVAGYYARRHPKGAAFRFERIADLYPDVDYAPEGLIKAARIWEELKEYRRAKVDYDRVARDYPKSSLAKNAAASAKRMDARLDADATAEREKLKAQSAKETVDGGTPDAAEPPTDDGEEPAVEEEEAPTPTPEEADGAPAD